MAISKRPAAPKFFDYQYGNNGGLTLFFSGVGTAGSSLILFDDKNKNGKFNKGEELKTVSIGNDGLWQADSGVLAFGKHTFRSIESTSGSIASKQAYFNYLGPQKPSTKPTVSFEEASKSVNEDASAQVALTVKLSVNKSPVPITINYSLNDGTATASDGDYGPGTGSVTFGPGETSQQILIPINNDHKPEPDENFTVKLLSSPNVNVNTAKDSAVVTLLNDDQFLSITQSLTAITETPGNPNQVTYTLTGEPNTSVQIGFTGSASLNDISVTGLSQNDQITLSSIGQASFTVTAKTDQQSEGNETLIAKATDISNNANSATAATVSIKDYVDNVPPVIQSGQAFSYIEAFLYNEALDGPIMTVNDVIGVVSASDNYSGIANFEIVSGNSFFAINKQGQITLNANSLTSAANDYEVGPNKFNLSITATDGAGNVSSPTIVGIAVFDNLIDNPTLGLP